MSQRSTETPSMVRTGVQWELSAVYRRWGGVRLWRAGNLVVWVVCCLRNTVDPKQLTFYLNDVDAALYRYKMDRPGMMKSIARSLRGIAHLSLPGCGIDNAMAKELASGLSDNTCLRSLELVANRFTSQGLRSIGARVSPALAHLDVSHNALQAVPSRLARLTQLRRLDLAGNGFGHALPPRLFSELTLLEELDLAGCALVSLPPDIEQLARLRVINLSDNPDLNGFPSGLWSLTSLRELHARYVLRLLTCLCEEAAPYTLFYAAQGNLCDKRTVQVAAVDDVARGRGRSAVAAQEPGPLRQRAHGSPHIGPGHADPAGAPVARRQ